MQGIIALDIDGTLTSENHVIEQEVISALNDHDRKGWTFIFITGRPFQWCSNALKEISFPYALAIQNGALLLQMPDRKILSRKCLEKKDLPLLQTVAKEEKTDFVIYSGFENDDWCFYSPSHFPPVILSYALERAKAFGEKWQSLSHLSKVPVSHFSSIKFFAKREQAYRMGERLEELRFHAPPNRDPYDSNYFVVQATHPEANKGDALRQFIELSDFRGPIIAAGDDLNDKGMLEAAHVKVVMANAPESILNMADIVASPNGIIDALQKSIQFLKEGYV